MLDEFAAAASVCQGWVFESGDLRAFGGNFRFDSTCRAGVLGASSRHSVTVQPEMFCLQSFTVYPCNYSLSVFLSHSIYAYTPMRMYKCMNVHQYICILYMCTQFHMYICIFLLKHICMHVNMYIYAHVCMYTYIYVIYVIMYMRLYMDGCMESMSVCLHVCMYACMHACMYVCVYVCMYVCMYGVYLCVYVCMYVCIHM